MKNNPEKYTPFFFLSALGNGGLTIGFFIFFMFMTSHPGTPIATFDSVWPYLTTGPMLVRGLSILCYALMLLFAYRHIKMLVWNIRQYVQYKKTSAFRRLLESNNEITLMAIPLALTMSINVMFVLGAMLVPNLWSVVEYLFPFSFMAFFGTGIYSLIIFYRYFSARLTNGHFKHSMNNSLGQMISSFAFAMNAVGFAAPAAMSSNPFIVSISSFCSLFFLVIAILLAINNLVLGFHAMMDQGISREGSASSWILIPILTLLGITIIRLNHGFHFLFGTTSGPVFYFVLCSGIVSLQIFFGILGFLIMRENNYFQEFIHGVVPPSDPSATAAKSPASYALICPGVASWVFGMFFLDKGLVHTGVVDFFSPAYFIILLPLLLVLLKTIQVNYKLNRRLLQ